MKNSEYFNEITIRNTIKAFKPNNALFEVRIVGKGNGRKKIISGYFRNADSLISAFDTINPKGANVYFTINKVNDACYSREQHDCFRVTDATTHDHEIDSYEWLFIDLDPVRIAEISSTNDELHQAEVLADKVYYFMRDKGFNEPIRALSGNGAHLLYKIDIPNNDENKALISKCLVVLASMFNTDKVKIDEVNHNQSRICKLYGTLAQKGSNTEERPHRMSALKSVPDEIKVNDISLLRLLADELPDATPAPTKSKNSKPSKPASIQNEFNLEDWLFNNNIEYIRKDSGMGCDIYPLKHCPFDHSHTNGDSKIFHYSDGAIAFKCHHNSCRNMKWQDVRLLYEPDAYNESGISPEDDERINKGWQEHKQYLMMVKTDNVEEVKNKLPKVSVISASELQSKVFDERYYAVDGMIPEGETIIAAPPKTGKSWLMLAMCLAISNGNKFLGFDTNKSDTLYMALEDGESFEQERLSIVLNGEKAPNNFHFVFSDVMPMNEGFLLQLDEILAQYPNIRVVVIDTLQFIKFRQGRSESAYECDYRTGRELKQYAEKNHLAIVVVTHTTKMLHIEDDMANVSGTNGVTGAADAVIVLNKDNRMDKEAKMFITGRKVRQSLHSIVFNDEDCQWHYVGIAEESSNKEEREQRAREEEYFSSDIREAVCRIADHIETEWKGKTGELVELATSLKMPIIESNKVVGGFLCSMMGMFLKHDNVQIERIKNGTGSTIYKIFPRFIECDDEHNVFIPDDVI